MGKWTEIRCDHVTDKWWTVDAWLTADDNEEGKVIATIDVDTARVVYLDKDAMYDEYAQEVINAKVDEIRKGGK